MASPSAGALHSEDRGSVLGTFENEQLDVVACLLVIACVNGAWIAWFD
jgi:hypothetical protein